MITLTQEIGDILKKRNLKLGTVESATGGLISHLITNVPGSSDYYYGSIITYSNELKMHIAGVKRATLDKHGAVSSQVAEEMAEGGRRLLNVDICLADTGIAGPTGATMGKPIGLFYLGISHDQGTFNRKFIFKGNREQNKLLAAEAALNWLKEYLDSIEHQKIKPRIIPVKTVVTCFLESNGKILIFRRSNQVRTYQGCWAGVSGYIEKTADEQALKEINEETSLSQKDVQLVRKAEPLEIIDPNLNVKWEVHPYLFHVKNPANIKFDWEHQESKWISQEEIDNFTTVPGLKTALNLVLKG